MPASHNVEDLIYPEEVEKFENLQDFLDSQVYCVNAYISYIEKITSIPFAALFHGSEPDQAFYNFFYLVYTSFYESCVITMTRLLMDEGKDCCNTLPVIQTRVICGMVKPEHRALFHKYLGSLRSDRKRVEKLKQSLKNLRNARIAHLLGDASEEDYLAEFRLQLDELKKLRDNLNKYYDALFNEPFGRSTNKVPYFHDPQYLREHDMDSDIDQLIAFAVDSSGILELPEEDQGAWEQHRKRLDAEGLAFLNEHRKRRGLPELA